MRRILNLSLALLMVISMLTMPAMATEEGEDHEHSWEEATCTAPKTCSVCQATEGEALDHVLIDGKCTVCAYENTNATENLELCVHGNAEDCEYCGAIAAVEADIEELPSEEEMLARDNDGRVAIYNTLLEVTEAYEKLPAEDQVRVSNLDKMIALHEAFTKLVAPTPENTIAVDTTNFPDPFFRAYVEANIDTDKNGALTEEECNAVTKIHKEEMDGSYSLQGIGFFPNLKELTWINGNLMIVDLSQNTALESVNFYNNFLSTLNVSNNSALTSLNCSKNKLISLDLSQNTSLSTADLSGNVSSISYSGNTVDLSKLPSGFDASRTSNWAGGSISGNTLTLNTGVTQISYSYDCGNNHTMSVTLNLVEDTGSTGPTEPTDPPAPVGPDDIAVNANNFPDTAFRDYVVKNFDTDGNQYLNQDEQNVVTIVSVKNMQISSLAGIEHFPNLEILQCTGNRLSTLDVRGNPKLIMLECAENQLTTLYIGQNPVLAWVDCANNQLISLDLSGARSPMEKFICSGNLFAIQTTGNTFDLGNLPGNFDVSKVSNWVGGTVSGNILTIEAGVTQVTYTYDCGNDQTMSVILKVPASNNGIPIDEIHFPDPIFRAYVKDNFDKDGDSCLSTTEISAVTTIDVFRMEIASLKGVEHFTALKKLSCDQNKLTSLDISKNTALTTLDCTSNQLTELNLSGNTNLTYLNCWNNQLTSLNVAQCTKLKNLECALNQLTALDVSNNTALTNLSCGENQLTQLDVSKNTLLKYLSCSINQLTQLDVSDNTALTYLGCFTNQLTSLVVSENTKLTQLDCSYNQLTSLDLSKNTALTTFDAEGNAYSIQVRDFDLATLPGDFNVAKASDWAGGTVSGNVLTVDPGATQVTYTYDCGNGKSMPVTLNVSIPSSGTTPSEPSKPVTPPAVETPQKPVVTPPAVTKPVKEDVTIAVIGESSSVQVDATIEDTTVTITSIRKETEKAMGGKDNDGAVKLDLSGVDREIDQVQFPVNDLHHIINKRDDVTLEVAFPQGSITLDTKSMEAVLDQSKGATLEITLKETKIEDLTNAQQNAIEDMEVYGSLKASLVITQTNTQISDFDGGKVTLSIPFEIPEDKLEKGFVVYGLNEKGEKVLCETRYEDGKLIWDAEELLDFVIVYDETAAHTFTSHNVKRGDTLWAISTKYGCTVDEIVKLNPDLIRNKHNIQAGWEIKVPTV